MRGLIKTISRKDSSYHQQTQQADGSQGTGLKVGSLITVERYKLKVQEMIQRGGYATIYRVKDQETGRYYAIKHMKLNTEKSLSEAQVKREATILHTHKDHPHFVRMCSCAFSHAQNPTDAYLLLEYCPTTLLDFMKQRRGKLEDHEVYLIFSSITQAVAALHKHPKPISHRDIKLENVLQNSRGKWVLCDFGSASYDVLTHRELTDPQRRAREERTIFNTTTPAYRAPEMWKLDLLYQVDTKADIWALGVLLYVLCFAKLPFSGDAEPMRSAILSGSYTLPDTRPLVMKQLIADMLQAHPVQRPDVEQIITRLAEVEPAFMPPDAAPTQPPRQAAESSASSHVAPTPAVGPPPLMPVSPMSNSASSPSRTLHSADNTPALASETSQAPSEDSSVANSDMQLSLESQGSELPEYFTERFYRPNRHHHLASSMDASSAAGLSGAHAGKYPDIRPGAEGPASFDTVSSLPSYASRNSLYGSREWNPALFHQLRATMNRPGTGDTSNSSQAACTYQGVPPSPCSESSTEPLPWQGAQDTASSAEVQQLMTEIEDLRCQLKSLHASNTQLFERVQQLTDSVTQHDSKLQLVQAETQNLRKFQAQQDMIMKQQEGLLHNQQMLLNQHLLFQQQQVLLTQQPSLALTSSVSTSNSNASSSSNSHSARTLSSAPSAASAFHSHASQSSTSGGQARILQAAAHPHHLSQQPVNHAGQLTSPVHTTQHAPLPLQQGKSTVSSDQPQGNQDVYPSPNFGSVLDAGR